MTNKPTNTIKKQTIVSQKDLSLILRILGNNWWIPLIIVPVFYAIGTFYIYRLTYIYKASTEFLLKSEDTYYKNNVLSDANFYGYTSYVDNLNETRIIQSYDLSSQVVEKLLDDIQVSYFIVGKVKTTEQFNGMPFKIRANSINPAFYERIFDFRVIDFDNFEITYENEGKKFVKRGQFDKVLLDLDLRILVSRQINFSRMTHESFKQILYQFNVHSKDYLINAIRSNLKVINPDYTQVLKVELKDVIPERAVLILDTLSSVYAQSKLKTKFELNERTISYIDKQLNEITFSLKNIEDTMQNYKEQKSIINLEWEQNDFLDISDCF